MGLRAHISFALLLALAPALGFSPALANATGHGGSESALESRIAAAPDPAAKARLLLEWSDTLEPTDPERALSVAREARALAGDDVRLQLAADAAIASLLRLLTDYPAALELANAGLARAEALPDAALAGRFTQIIGRTHWSIGDYPAAMEHYLSALRFADLAGDHALAFDAHTGISTLFNEFRQPDQARFHVEEARRLALALNDQSRLGDLHRLMGNFALQDGKLDDARALYEESQRFHTAAGNERGVGDALQNLGHASERSGNLELAREQTLRSIALYEQLGVRRNRFNSLRQLGRILVKQGRAAEGLAYQEEGLAIARTLNSRTSLAHSYRELARATEALGDFRAAVDWQQKLLAETESIFSERSRQQLTILNTRYIAERRELEIDLLRREQALTDAELARAHVQRRWLLAFAALGAVAVAAVVSRQRIKLRAEQRILAETRAARDAAEQADTLKSRLLAIASHDLKSPLRAVVGAADQLVLKPADAALVSELSPRIGAEARRMLDLVRDLIDVSALEAGHFVIERAPLDAADLAAACVAGAENRARDKSVRLELIRPDGEFWVNADPLRLRQAIDNLLDNAVKFTPPDRAVRVSVRRTDEAISIAVSDEGPGISPADLADLFRPFSSGATGPDGEVSSGLGLSIAREIVARHDGELTVRSRPGSGATFEIALPPLPA